MYGGKNFSRTFHVSDEWREAVVWNYSCVNALKGTVLHRTVPRHRVNRKPIRTYVERFHAEPFESPVSTQPLTHDLCELHYPFVWYLRLVLYFGTDRIEYCNQSWSGLKVN